MLALWDDKASQGRMHNEEEHRFEKNDFVMSSGFFEVKVLNSMSRPFRPHAVKLSTRKTFPLFKAKFTKHKWTHLHVVCVGFCARSLVLLDNSLECTTVPQGFGALFVQITFFFYSFATFVQILVFVCANHYDKRESIKLSVPSDNGYNYNRTSRAHLLNSLRKTDEN